MPSYLLSIFYASSKNTILLKFFDTDSNRVFLHFLPQEHHPYLLSDIDEDTFFSIISEAKKKKIVRLSKVKKYDVIRDEIRELTKIEGRDPLVIGRGVGNLRDFLSKRGYGVWEAHIKYYQSYTYDMGLIPSMPYRINDDGTIELISEIHSETDDPVLKDYLPLFDTPLPKLKSIALDIEVYSPANVMPDPSNPEFPIISVALVDSDGNEWIFLYDVGEIPVGDLPPNAKLYKDELRMLRDVISILENYAVLFTFSGDQFDLPYIMRRISRLGEDPKPFMFYNKYVTLETGIHIDLHRVYSNRSLQGYIFNNAYSAYSLEDIAANVLGEHKLEMPKFTESTLGEIAEYNLQDARLTERLGTVMDGGLMDILFLFSRLSRLPIEELARSGISLWTKSLIYNAYRQRNWLIPNPNDILDYRGKEVYSAAIIKGKKYQGAIVLDPVPGIHFDVYVVDFASLYPSIISRYNVSFETINCPHKECRKNRPYEGLPHWVCKRIQGLIPATIGALRDIRVSKYKPLSKIDPDPEKRKLYSAVAGTLKVFLNASYGVFGFESFPLYSPPVAETITAIARKSLLYVIDKAKKRGYEVIYGDTDGVALKGVKREELNDFMKEISRELKIDLELERHFKWVIFSERKKNYLGLTEEREIVIKGLMGKKKNTPPFIKQLFNDMIELLKEVDSLEAFELAKEKIREKILEYYQRLMDDDYEIEDLAFSVLLTKNLDEYVKTTPQHVKAARILQRYGKKIEKGHVIKFIKSHSKSRVTPLELARKEDIDKEAYVRMMESVMEQILDPLGMDFQEIIKKKKFAVLLTEFL